MPPPPETAFPPPPEAAHAGPPRTPEPAPRPPEPAPRAPEPAPRAPEPAPRPPELAASEPELVPRVPEPHLYDAPPPTDQDRVRAAWADGNAAVPADRRDWLADARRLTGRGGPGAREARGGGRRGRPRWGRLLALGVLAAILLALAWFANALFQPFKGDGGGAVRVSIPQGATLSQIADRLERSGVIDDAGFFELRARIDGASGDLRPGSYELRQDMSFAAAIDALQAGVPPNVVQVSIPEGLSRREIRPLTKGLPGNYMRASLRSSGLDPRDYDAPRGASLEGFLFPATYELKKGRRVRALVNEQVANFKRNFDKVDLSFAERKNLTAYDVLIIASLIEREAMVAKERPLIASVIYNRLSEGIPLGIDATVRFVTNNWKRPLRQSELENPSLYNTRVHSGLPPGPIGNPGLASIRAAAKPAKTNYLFYVVKVDSCGEHRFAETDAEFQAYVNEYNRARDARGGRSPTKC